MRRPQIDRLRSSRIRARRRVASRARHVLPVCRILVADRAGQGDRAGARGERLAQRVRIAAADGEPDAMVEVLDATVRMTVEAPAAVGRNRRIRQVGVGESVELAEPEVSAIDVLIERPGRFERVAVGARLLREIRRVESRSGDGRRHRVAAQALRARMNGAGGDLESVLLVMRRRLRRPGD